MDSCPEAHLPVLDPYSKKTKKDNAYERDKFHTPTFPIQRIASVDVR